MKYFSNETSNEQMTGANMYSQQHLNKLMTAGSLDEVIRLISADHEIPDPEKKSVIRFASIAASSYTHFEKCLQLLRKLESSYPSSSSLAEELETTYKDTVESVVGVIRQSYGVILEASKDDDLGRFKEPLLRDPTSDAVQSLHKNLLAGNLSPDKRDEVAQAIIERLEDDSEGIVEIIWETVLIGRDVLGVDDNTSLIKSFGNDIHKSFSRAEAVAGRFKVDIRNINNTTRGDA